jgi:hypothetical protein
MLQQEGSLAKWDAISVVSQLKAFDILKNSSND